MNCPHTAELCSLLVGCNHCCIGARLRIALIYPTIKILSCPSTVYIEMGEPVTLLSYDALARLLPTSETAFPGSDRAHRQGSRSGKRGKTKGRDGKASRLRYRLEGVRGAEIGQSYARDVSQSFRKFVNPTGIPAGGVVALRIPDASSFEKSHRDKKRHAIPSAVRGARNRYGAPAGRYLANDDAYVVDPPA